MEWIILIISHSVAFLLGALSTMEPAAKAYRRADKRNQATLHMLKAMDALTKKLMEARK